MKKAYDAKSIVIIDVRSDIEFKVIHTKTKIHIPMSKITFVNDVKNLIKENPGKKFVFYCNGVICLKAYEATKKLILVGVQNVFAFDGGIPAWSEAYPKETLLLGKEVMNHKEQLISKDKFNKRCVDYTHFKQIATTNKDKVLLFDVRDFVQSKTKLPSFESVRPTPMKKFIESYIFKNRF